MDNPNEMAALDKMLEILNACANDITLAINEPTIQRPFNTSTLMAQALEDQPELEEEQEQQDPQPVQEL